MDVRILRCYFMHTEICQQGDVFRFDLLYNGDKKKYKDVMADAVGNFGDRKHCGKICVNHSCDGKRKGDTCGSRTPFRQAQVLPNSQYLRLTPAAQTLPSLPLAKAAAFPIGISAQITASSFQFSMPAIWKNNVESSTTPACPPTVNTRYTVLSTNPTETRSTNSCIPKLNVTSSVIWESGIW